MSVQRWSRRPAEVEAIRLTEDNAAEVAAWAGGRVERTDRGVQVWLPQTRIPIRPGEWGVRDILPDGLGHARCMRPMLFEHLYRETGAG